MEEGKTERRDKEEEEGQFMRRWIIEASPQGEESPRMGG